VPIGRRRARREALFFLYQRDLMGSSARDVLLRAERSGAVVDGYTRLLVLGVESRLTDLDGMIARHLQGWTVERLAALERNILRVALFEMSLRSAGPAIPGREQETVVPVEVAIDQAVELTKRYCSDEAGALVNGVLGAVLAAGEI
jgi:transcription antitermination protein NusB